MLYSYKNCYGLSIDIEALKTAKIAYSYKNCYGLSASFHPETTHYKVFVQELLWFIFA